MSEEIGKNLTASQILQLLQYLQENLPNPSFVMSLKTVLSGIKSQEVIEYLSTYMAESLGPLLCKNLRQKDASESLYEVFYLLLELSDSLAMGLYDKKLIQKAERRCQKSLELFPVHLPLFVR